MQMGMIGLGRMGTDMVRRLMRGGHECVVYDLNTDAVARLSNEGARGVSSLEGLAGMLRKPRVAWLMLPAAAVEQVVDELSHRLEPGDTIVDGGNSHYIDDIRRAKVLATRRIQYVDVGTSGGVWGLDRGFCQMIGGDSAVVQHLDPLFATLAPATGSAPRTTGREGAPRGTAERGYLHCGPSGAGHFVKMVHNGIEYGIMAAYAEGLNILRHANAGDRPRGFDAETAPLRNPEFYQYDFDLPEIAETWRRGSVIASWLLDLTAGALLRDPTLDSFAGRVSDSGEGRWTVAAAIDEGVPAHVLSAALYERFSSRGHANFADRLLAAMRYQFGGHLESALQLEPGTRSRGHD
ncbi:MAG: decarboxylating 6-phosphogluconate dehydrogenase [Alphaproteobacteria bacterium]|nr:decarboxylating 6-phosphogluconate dehydrogenase [Alphaproteobacteria bacterium]